MAELKPTAVAVEMLKELNDDNNRREKEERIRLEARNDRIVREHIKPYFKTVDEMSMLLMDASTEETFDARERQAEQWANRLVDKVGFTEAEIKAENGGRK